MSPELHAEYFAAQYHAGQVRKYTGEAYIAHPLAVAQLVRSVPHTSAMVVAALLHDVVEDTEANLCQIGVLFGAEVAELVEMVTNPPLPDGVSRAQREKEVLAHLAHASPSAQTLKLADIIDNTYDVERLDPDFARIYLPEKQRALAYLKQGDPTLFQWARHLVYPRGHASLWLSAHNALAEVMERVRG